jgi:phage terminase large subunit
MLGRSFTRRVEKAYQRHTVAPIQHLYIDNDAYSFNLINEDSELVKYIPTETALKFHQSNEFVRGIKGAYGSGKTTAMIADILLRTCKMPTAPNGKRYARWAIIRNTYGELESTTYVSWMAWFGNLGNVQRNKKPILTVRHEFNDDVGTVELEVIFLALDSESDVRKLKSLEVCGVFINEASEIEKPIFDHSKGRVGRYMLNVLGDYWKGIIFDTNPPNERHWIYDLFEKKNEDGHVLFNQPPGLLKNDNGHWICNPQADNFSRLGAYYYLNMTHGATEEFIKVYCLGEYGTVISGKKVYPEYNDDLHSIDILNLNDTLPLYIGMDFGLTPAAVLVQETTFGTYNIVHELTSESLGIKQFIENVLTPFLSRHCDGIEIAAIIGDPAGNKMNENDMTSCFDILHEAGYMIDGCATNLITPRLEAVRATLTTLIEGKPKITVSRRTCPTLRDGFLGGYHFKKMRVLGSDIYDTKPLKNEYSHIHDALQYILLYLNSQSKLNLTQQEPYKPQLMRF